MIETKPRINRMRQPSLIFLLSFFIRPQPPPDIFSEESDTASVTSSITSSPKPERKARKKKPYDVKPRIDTNLNQKRKELVQKSSSVATPRLRVATPVPYNSRNEDYSPLTPRSRDPSPTPSPRSAHRWTYIPVHLEVGSEVMVCFMIFEPVKEKL